MEFEFTGIGTIPVSLGVSAEEDYQVNIRATYPNTVYLIKKGDLGYKITLGDNVYDLANQNIFPYDITRLLDYINSLIGYLEDGKTKQIGFFIDYALQTYIKIASRVDSLLSFEPKIAALLGFDVFYSLSIGDVIISSSTYNILPTKKLYLECPKTSFSNYFDGSSRFILSLFDYTRNESRIIETERSLVIPGSAINSMSKVELKDDTGTIINNEITLSFIMRQITNNEEIRLAKNYEDNERKKVIQRQIKYNDIMTQIRKGDYSSISMLSNPSQYKEELFNSSRIRRLPTDIPNEQELVEKLGKDYRIKIYRMTDNELINYRNDLLIAHGFPRKYVSLLDYNIPNWQSMTDRDIQIISEISAVRTIIGDTLEYAGENTQERESVLRDLIRELNYNDRNKIVNNFDDEKLEDLVDDLNEIDEAKIEQLDAIIDILNRRDDKEYVIDYDNLDGQLYEFNALLTNEERALLNEESLQSERTENSAPE